MDQPQDQKTSPIPPSPAARSGSMWEIFFPARTVGHRDAIYVASFPEIFFLWPSILVLFLCAFLQGVAGLDSSVLGWFTIAVLSFNLLILVQDLDQKKFVILILLLIAIVLGVWIVNLYGFLFLRRFASWILSFQPEFSTDAYLVLGVVLLALFVWGLITPLFSYWKFGQNEFTHYTQPIGRDISIARIHCTVCKEIPDVFECLLGFGAGTLVIRKDNQILASIPHIPFLGWRMDALEHILAETRVIVDKEH